MNACVVSGYAENVYKDTDNVIMAHCAEHGVNLPRKYAIILYDYVISLSF